MRQKGLSQLDYLWVNYGTYFVSDTILDNSIPSTKLLKLLVDGISNDSVSSVKIVNKKLVGSNTLGDILFSINLEDLNNRTITNFGKRYITQEDIDKGCEYSKNTPVYFLGFSDNSELLAPIDEYFGQETNSVIITIYQNLISASLKINNQNSVVLLKETPKGILGDLNISPEIESIKLTKELEGLKAQIVLDNSDKTLKFKYLTLLDYLDIKDPDPTTVYFIQNKKYFYFGKNLIGEGNTNLDDYYTKQEIDETIADKVKDAVADVSGMNWKFI